MAGLAVRDPNADLPYLGIADWSLLLNSRRYLGLRHGGGEKDGGKGERVAHLRLIAHTLFGCTVNE